jgi:thiol-disulfide isomerase/thioredoxin
MKILKLTMLMLLVPMLMSAQGMTFEPQGTLFKDALAKAQKTGKKIFLDCYTSWCGPCKLMARTVFPSDSAGTYMNPRFVNLQIDMEKGEGPELGKKWQVTAYPTFIIFDSDGTELNRFLGASTTTVFLEKVANSLTDRTLASLKQKYEAGDHQPATALAYLNALSHAQLSDDADAVAEEMLKGKSAEFLNDSTLRVVFLKYIKNPFAESFQYAATHQDELAESIGNKQMADFKISSVFRNYPAKLVSEKDGKATIDEEQFNKFVALMNKLGYSDRESVRLNALIDLAKAQGDYSSYIKYIKEYLNTPSIDATDLQLLNWAKPFAEANADSQAKKDMIDILEQRLIDLTTGVRKPQTKIGNMILSGNMKDTLTKVIQLMKSGKIG